MSRIMKSSIMREMVALKVSELEHKIDSIKSNPELSKNTKQVQGSAQTRKMHLFAIMESILNYASDEIILTDDEGEWFDSLVSLDTERNTCLIKVKKGDSLMGLIAANHEVKDVVNKIKKACDKAGLTLNMSTGIVE